MLADLLTDPTVILSFLTLAALEIVLGIDNLIFVQIVAGRVSPEKQDAARKLGLGFALLTRLLLLSVISVVARLVEPVMIVGTFAVSWRDVVLILGGLFLLVKGTMEIHHLVAGHVEEGALGGKYLTLVGAIVQIALLDIIFSLDSVITAIGMADHLSVMIAAVVVAMIVMIATAGPIGHFVQNHPTVKMLCLSFLLLVGGALVADGLHFHIPKGYLYFAIIFSALVEGLNFLMRRRWGRRSV